MCPVQDVTCSTRYGFCTLAHALYSLLIVSLDCRQAKSYMGHSGQLQHGAISQSGNFELPGDLPCLLYRPRVWPLLPPKLTLIGMLSIGQI